MSDLPKGVKPLLVSEAVSAVFLFFVILFLGCEAPPPPQDPLDQVEPTISSFEEIEAQIHQIESTTRERDARERIYFHFFAERDALLEIAQGDYNSNSSLHRALVQEMAWVTLGELLERLPEFQLRVDRERDVPPPPADTSAEPADPTVEKLPEEFQ